MRSYLKNADTGTFITRYVSFNKTQALALTVQTALDGTEYLTRFGAPVYSYLLELHVDDAGRELLFQAADLLDLLEVKVKLGTFTGRLKELGAFEEEYHGWYKTTVLLSSVSEVIEL